jgi:hypothetical protein
MNESVDEDPCQRLVGQRLRSVPLSSTGGGIVDLAAPPTGRTVIYCYPRTAEPGKPAPTDCRCAGIHAVGIPVSGPLSGAASPWRRGFRPEHTNHRASGRNVQPAASPLCRVERRRHALH